MQTSPLPTPASAQDLAAEAADEYISPDGRFSAPIPTNWTAAQQEGYVRLAGPNDGIVIYLLTVQAESGEAAIETGWQIIDPAFAQPIQETVSPRPSGGIEALTLITYEYDEANEQFYQAVARLYDNTYYLLLIDGDITAIQQRQAQISIIDSGFTITALEETDLAGTEPLPVRAVVPELETFINDGLAQFGIPGAAVADCSGWRDRL
jgi:hypothetical protein